MYKNILCQKTFYCSSIDVHSFVQIFNNILHNSSSISLTTLIISSFNRLWIILRDLAFCRTSKKIVQRCQITLSWWPLISPFLEVIFPVNLSYFISCNGFILVFFEHYNESVDQIHDGVFMNVVRWTFYWTKSIFSCDRYNYIFSFFFIFQRIEFFNNSTNSYFR